MRMAVVDDAAKLLRQRLSELDDERKKLEAALQALTDGRRGSSSPRRRRRAVGTSTRRQTTPGRAGRGQRREQLLARIKRHPDTKLADHAKAIGISGNHASSVVRQLLESGDVVKTARGRYAVKA